MKKFKTNLIPVSQPTIAKNAKKYIIESLKSGWLSVKGPNVDKFERKFAKFVGTKYAVATSSGTSALHLSLAALKIKKDDEIIVPTLTMIASVLPIIYQNATPVLVDSEKETGNIDPNKIEEKISKKTKAIIIVHLHGHPVDMDSVMKIAKKYNLPVIEDAAEAHGALYKKVKIPISNDLKEAQSSSARRALSRSEKYGIELFKNWKKTGSVGNIGCFSFYGNKILAIGEGGMITTNDKKIADEVRSLSNLARSPRQHFLHTQIGFAYRMSNLQASLGLAQLEEINMNVKRKREIAKIYNSYLKNIPHLELPVEKTYAKSVFWQYDILVNKNSSISRNKLETILAKKGIETRRIFLPMHKQPALLKLGLFRNENYPIAEDLSNRGICLPSGLAIKNSEIKYVCDVIGKIFSTKGRSPFGRSFKF